MFVIIGLVTGGVLVAQDLIRAAQIRNTIAEKEHIKASIMLFKGKYRCLPGDCSKAVALGIDTRDGDGDGLIGYQHTSGDGFGQYRAWYQLSQAGFLKWQIDSSNSLGAGTRTLGQHYPDAAYASHIGWGFGFEHSNKMIKLGAGTGGQNEVSWVNGVPATGALSIDNKIDDGVFTTGRVRDSSGAHSSSPTCRRGAQLLGFGMIDELDDSYTCILAFYHIY